MAHGYGQAMDRLSLTPPLAPRNPVNAYIIGDVLIDAGVKFMAAAVAELPPD